MDQLRKDLSVGKEPRFTIAVPFLTPALFRTVKDQACRALIEMAREMLPGGAFRELAFKVRDESGRELMKVAIKFELQDLELTALVLVALPLFVSERYRLHICARSGVTCDFRRAVGIKDNPSGSTCQTVFLGEDRGFVGMILGVRIRTGLAFAHQIDSSFQSEALAFSESPSVGFNLEGADARRAVPHDADKPFAMFSVISTESGPASWLAATMASIPQKGESLIVAPKRSFAYKVASDWYAICRC